MSDVLHSSRRFLPYGRLLNRLFTLLQLPFNNPVTPKTSPLDSSTLKQMSNLPGSSKRPREDTSFEEEDEEHDEGGNSPRISVDQYEELKNKIEKNSKSIKRNNSHLNKMYNFMKKAFPNCSRSPSPSPLSSP
ncbi:hypothetical protein L1987_06049 [Smallanthus sonchifolius]|uniref:Uncharacterized protein n=1 Tax=Smallanthus sonchifolius TaxID=185202 RepID=A0ACB9JX24_9ASTR|nr:hypothetical protein L1987_06049 [Smallanthus sonchifolius]